MCIVTPVKLVSDTPCDPVPNTTDFDTAMAGANVGSNAPSQ